METTKSPKPEPKPRYLSDEQLRLAYTQLAASKDSLTASIARTRLQAMGVTMPDPNAAKTTGWERDNAEMEFQLPEVTRGASA